MKNKDRAMKDEWLKTPESDASVPDFVERDLEKPFEFDLSEWAAVEPLPDFAERVVRALEEMRSRSKRGVDATPRPPVDRQPSASPAEDKDQIPTSGPKTTSLGKRTPEDPPRPSIVHALPANRRVAAARH